MRDMIRLLDKADIKLIDVGKAVQAWHDFRANSGISPNAPLLTPESANLKFMKSGKKFDFATYGLSLAPWKTSGTLNVCRFATACREACVAHSGNGRYDKVIRARRVRTQFLAENPSAFVTVLTHEIGKAVEKEGEIALRLNTFSDIPWEWYAPWILTQWGDKVHLYDYTKWPVALRPDVEGYDLTRSATEKQTDAEIEAMLKAGARVAVCFDLAKKAATPPTWKNFPVVDGDMHDARFTEDGGTVVLLRPKGSARRLGFVRPLVTT